MKNKTKNNKKSTMKKVLTIVGSLVILATVIDLGKYAFNKMKDPTRCDNEEALQLVGKLIHDDIRNQYKVHYGFMTPEDQVRYDLHLEEFNYLEGDKGSCLGVAYFKNGASSKYEYKIFYDKKADKLSVQTYKKYIRTIQ